jgi:hypothetical protein
VSRDDVPRDNKQNGFVPSTSAPNVLIVVDLTTLNIQQLSEVKKQLDEGILSNGFP